VILDRWPLSRLSSLTSKCQMQRTRHLEKKVFILRCRYVQIAAAAGCEIMITIATGDRVRF
jgi:hypothetical protein